MTSAAQMEANRRNAQHSTGPRTSAGRSRSSQNALKHGFTGRLLVGLQYGPFADDPAELQEFIQAVLAELAPVTARERAEALNIVGLYVRRSRLVELEAMALAHATRTRMLPPAEPGGPARVIEEDLMLAGATALGADLFDRLPRYEGHLSRELDKSLARYAQRLTDLAACPAHTERSRVRKAPKRASPGDDQAAHASHRRRRLGVRVLGRTANGVESKPRHGSAGWL